jgi:hypothetical protein
MVTKHSIKSLDPIDEKPRLKASIQSKKSKRSAEKYDYKSIYEGGRGNSNLGSKRESIKPKPLEDEKIFSFVVTDNTPVNIDVMSDKVVNMPESRINHKKGDKSMNQSQLVEGQKWGGESPKQLKSIGRKTNNLSRSMCKTKSTMRSSKNFS